jgi:NDP-sugar pyrophosphorylase family protein
LGEEAYGLGFVPPEFLGPGEDEYRIREEQLKNALGRESSSYRALAVAEIAALAANGNRCRDWGLVLVTDPFVTDLVRNCEFAGLVRLGAIRRAVIEHHDFLAPVGITDSRLVACDIGDDCAIHDCHYLAHYIVGHDCVLLSNDEIHVSNHSKFGNGIVMEGESEQLRVQLDLMNEGGGRSVSPFRDMACADAYLWARRRDDPALLAAFRAMTDAMYDRRRGRYGTIGRGSVLKSNRIIKDVAIGESAYVKGANKLKNLTILSSDEERTQIGEGVELVNGIVGRGCRVFYGSKAVRFVLGANSSLKYGARLIHSVLGDNSTVSCCEMLNNLIFPGHEQHHNTSFLIASLVRGQSNLAAGATIGSNHNSRANDGEIEAGRGFWPGLSTSVKHSSRFASFCLLAKGDYRFEIDLSLPFCLVDDDRSRDALVLVPAYWWTHNLYALLRNEGKLLSRDKRAVKTQKLEFSPFAPDTAEEMIAAIGLIEGWAGAHAGKTAAGGLGTIGANDPRELEIPPRVVENSNRPVVLRRPGRALRAYREMLLWYAANAVLAWVEGAIEIESASGDAGPSNGAPRSWTSLREVIGSLDSRSGERESSWENLGGQLVPAAKLEELLARVRSLGIRDWNGMHAEYARLSAEYVADKAVHAWAVLRWLSSAKPAGGAATSPSELLANALDDLISLSVRVEAEVFATRAKDYANPFRKATFRSEAEMLAVVGRAEDNPFVETTRRDMAELRKRALRLRAIAAAKRAT